MTRAHVNRLYVLCVAALGLSLCGASSSVAQGTRKHATYTVTIDASRFDLDVLTVKTGDTVVWVNKDIVAHTATSQAGGYDSGMIASCKSWKYSPKQAGEFPYTCTYHPTMKAMLRVK